MERREFLQKTTAAAVAGAVLSGSTSARAQGPNIGPDGLDHRNERSDRMEYRKLGKTNFMCSRLVFGGGGALIAGRGVRLLERAYEAGINFYDLGTDKYYKGAESSFAPFCKRHRDDIWVTSKAMVREGITFRGNDPELNVEEAHSYADYWSKLLDQSLTDLGTDYVDAYYLMGVDNPAIVKSEEMGNAFLKAKEAGKVGHFGISTHTNQGPCLEAAIETGWYSLAMIGITPAGWFDLKTLKPVERDEGIKALRPLLDKAREAGIGLIGMKAALYLAARPYQGVTTHDDKSPRADAYDRYYSEALMESGLTPFQRSYAHVLANGVDVMNSDMQNFKHFEENIVAANKAHTFA